MALRRPPRNVPKGRNETMLREYRVLAALRDTDVPHTRALAACDDPSVIGACFYLMEFVDGWSCMSSIGVAGAVRHRPRGAQGPRLGAVDAIAKLARVDWRARGLEGFGKPDGFHERQVDRWLAHLAQFKFRDLPGLDDAASVAARATSPKAYTPGHHPRRLPVRQRHVPPRRAGAMAAIVDWEMATIGDPLLDLAWVVMGWPNPDEDRTDAGLRRLHRHADARGAPRALRARAAGCPSTRSTTTSSSRASRWRSCSKAATRATCRAAPTTRRWRAFGDVVLDMARKAAELAESSAAVTGPPHLNQPGGRFRAAIHPNIAGRERELRAMADAVRRLVRITTNNTGDAAWTADAAARIAALADALEPALPAKTPPRYGAARPPEEPHDIFPYDVMLGIYNPLALPIEMGVAAAARCRARHLRHAL